MREDRIPGNGNVHWRVPGSEACGEEHFYGI